MSSRSIVHRSLFLLFPMSFCFNPSARADGFQCAHKPGGIEPVLICSDDNLSPDGSVAHVSLRKMPRWGIHAGLTVVDLCVVPANRAGIKNDNGFVIDVQSDPKSINAQPDRHCERRYCTDRNRLHSFAVNSIPFPVGWTSVSFWLGYQHKSFSIHCDALISHQEADEGAEQ
ncbi:MAG: hypothetical protein ACO3A4_06945 [Silvanigrellaceae bacterium]